MVRMWLTILKVLAIWSAISVVVGLVLASAIGDAKAENERHWINGEG